MTSINWLLTLPLVLVAIGCSFVRLRDLVARFRGLRAANSPVFLISALTSSLALWTLLGWVLWWPLGWVAGWGWGVVLLAAVGVLLGAIGMPEIGAGAALTYTFWRPDETLLLWWATPIIGVATLKILLRSEPWPVRPGHAKRIVRRMFNYGNVIEPPEVLDWVWQVLHLAGGCVPALLAAVLPFPGASTVDWWMRLGTGALISVHVWWFDLHLRSLTRYVRRGSRTGLLAMAATIGLAATPLGSLVVDLWRLLPGPDGLVGGVLLVGLDVVVWLLMSRPQRVQDTGVMSKRRGPMLAGVARDVLVRRGLLMFAVVGLFHPAGDLLVGATMLVGFETLTGLAGITRKEMTVLYAIDAGQFINYGDEPRRKVLGWWLYDSFLARPRRPDYQLVVSLAWQALRSSQGQQVPGVGIDSRASALIGTGALRWLEIADEALDFVESEVMPRFLDRHIAHLQREQHRARWMCLVARAIVYQYLNWRDDALSAWRAAAGHADAATAPNLAAMARASGAALLASRLARPHEALHEVEEQLNDTALAVPTRRHALVVAASAHLAMDDQTTAGTLLAQARALTLSRGEWRAAAAKEEAKTTVPGFRGGREGLLAQLNWMESAVAMAVEGSEIAEVPTSMQLPAMTLATRALIAQSRGDDAQARELLLSAARIGTRDGHLTWVHNANLHLAWMSEDFAECYRYARAAISALEEMRGRVLDAELRMGAGSDATGNAYETAAMALVAQGPSDARGWPRHPITEAFELVERARSRVFLELLGGSAAQAVPAELTGLAEEEEEAAEAFRQAVQAQDGVSDTERPAALEYMRAARTRLDDVWRELNESGADGKRYAQLRRGEPVSIDEVRGQLLDGVVLVEYFVIEDRTILFVVRANQDEPEIVVVELTRDDIRTAAAELRTDPLRAGTDAFRPLVEPLLDHCSEGERLCLVPHDALHLVPLHAVEVDGRPLADRNAVSYLPAAGLLRYTNADSPRSSGAVIMADSRADRPLAHSRVQASQIAELFEPPVELLIGDEVTLDTVRSVTARIWHVACHGEFDQGDPRRSGIVLADGRCTVADLMSLRLDCELVTFSACETGVAERAPGDELIGLTRALIYAGARAVLVSLWPVDEISTSILMQRFYEALVAGADKSTALREAQHQLRTMTAADAIGYCQNAARHVDAPFVIERDITDLRFRARDFAVAAAAYATLAGRTPADSLLRRDLTAAAVRGRRAARADASVDYGIRPYEQPYHWASFVLVGDWR